MEDLNHKILIFNGYLERLQSLDYIVSEAWLGSTTSIYLGQSLSKQKVSTMNITVFHPYVGDLVEYQSNLVDQYLTMGWISKILSFCLQVAFSLSNTNAQPLPNISICMLVIQSLKLRLFTHPCTPILIIPVIFTLRQKILFPFRFADLCNFYRGYPKDYNVKISIWTKNISLRIFSIK